MTGVFVGLGSNLGDRAAMLDAAVAMLRQLPGVTVVRRSSVFSSPALLPPEDPAPQPDYLNAVVELRCELPALQLLDALKQIERTLGRTPAARWAPRLIDLDLLLFGTLVLKLPQLVVPHPGLASRRFVLAPLVELAPDLEHPVLRRTMGDLLASLPLK